MRTPLDHFIKECDFEALKTREEIEEKSQITNIKWKGRCRIKINGKAVANSIKKVIRIEGGMKYEKQQLQKKLGDRGDVIDIDTRNAIPSNKVTASIVKCKNGYNHYGVCYAFINDKMAEECCPR